VTKRTFTEYSNDLKKALSLIDSRGMQTIVNLISDTAGNCGTIWLVGNGGSASTASHFATDLSRCSSINGKLIKAISLCDNLSLITAISNDYSYQEIFSRQLLNLSKNGDLLISISASGNSINIIKAIEYAKLGGITSVAFTAFDGGTAKSISDYHLHVPTNMGDYGVAEDSHLVICHYISSILKTNKNR